MPIHTIKMPDIGEGIAEVELVGWHVREGDQVSEDQPLAEVMTDKAAVEIPSPVNGRVQTLCGALGEMIAVGAPLIHIELADDSAPPTQPVAAPTDPQDPTSPQATCPSRSTSVEPEPAAACRQATHPRPLASPSIRRRAREHDIDLHALQGSGPGGRIIHGDIDATLARTHPPHGTAGHPAHATTPANPPPVAAATGPTARIGTQQIQVIGLRRRIAEKMQASMQRIPHFSYVEEVDVTDLEALRQALNIEYSATHGRLTLLPFLIQALARATEAFPQINACYDDEAGIITRHAALHLGIATQTPGGLVVPVLRHAESRDLWGNAAEITRLSHAAREARLPREVLSGSTLTLTSLGALGGIASTPIINYPEVAIVGVNRQVERPVVRHGRVEVRRMMNLSSSFDHRVVDGMDAARFIQELRRLLETPALLFLPTPG